VPKRAFIVASLPRFERCGADGRFHNRQQRA
jgi:hypothetical protein